MPVATRAKTTPRLHSDDRPIRRRADPNAPSFAKCCRQEVARNESPNADNLRAISQYLRKRLRKCLTGSLHVPSHLFSATGGGSRALTLADFALTPYNRRKFLHYVARPGDAAASESYRTQFGIVTQCGMLESISLE